MNCFFHKWTAWGPPYEAFSAIGKRNTFQQKKCERCEKRRVRRVAHFGHIAAKVPMGEDRQLESPPDTPDFIEPPRPARRRRYLD